MPEYAKVPAAGLISGITYNKDDVASGRCCTSATASSAMVCRAARVATSPISATLRPESITNLDEMVFKGPHTNKGMPDFTGKLTMDQVTKLRAFIAGTADAIRPKQ